MRIGKTGQVAQMSASEVSTDAGIEKSKNKKDDKMTMTNECM